MPESLLSRRLKLGKFLGIDLFVHWSFALLVGFVAVSSADLGVLGMVFAVLQLFGVFLCVTLHEYGHAMAARGFGIGTADITLLPIGGVARLRQMPRIPWQELIVAIAGPAVNVVIVTLLLTIFYLFRGTETVQAMSVFLNSWFTGTDLSEETAALLSDLFVEPSLAGYAVVMLVINVMLVLFNLIPAFPMDGGRVFRSLLAMVMQYRKATFVASRVGLVCAALMAMGSLYLNPGNPIPVLIAAFIGYAGIAEANQVEVMETVGGLTVRRVMVHNKESLPMDATAAEIVQRWSMISVPSLPVVTPNGIVVGMLRLRDVLEALRKNPNEMRTAGQLINHDVSPATIRHDDPLDKTLMGAGKQSRRVPVVDDEGVLIGIVDLDSLLMSGELAKHAEDYLYEPVDTGGDRFDQVL